jgi:ribosome recycling factor
VRTYAKKSKDNKKSKAEQQDVGAEVKEPLFNQGQFEARFEQCVQSLKEHLSNIRVGRANPCKI